MMYRVLDTVVLDRDLPDRGLLDERGNPQFSGKGPLATPPLRQMDSDPFIVCPLT